AVTALLALLAQSALRQEMYVSELSEVGGGDQSFSVALLHSRCSLYITQKRNRKTAAELR
ncbi:hypothetical protein, partial [Cellvibrio sp. OA-2007]|uniref:hypothetical protein n=1 Tax=Cellvibrio sp. OA-2007 TaxID=529823 RepID=UPI001EE6B7AC